MAASCDTTPAKSRDHRRTGTHGPAAPGWGASPRRCRTHVDDMRRELRATAPCRRPRSSGRGRLRPGPGSPHGPGRRSHGPVAPDDRRHPGSAARSRAAATSTLTSTRTERSAARPPVAHGPASPARRARAPARNPDRPGRSGVAVADHPLAGGERRLERPGPRARPGRPPSAAPRPAATALVRPGVSRMRRKAAPTGVAPGSKVRRAPSASARARAWVDLPQPSMPSSAIRRPRAGISERFGRRSLLRRGGLLGGPGLLGRAFFPAFLPGLLGRAFLLGPRLLGRLRPSCASRARRPGARRAARTPARCRWTPPTSPLRRLALVVPSVT